MAVRRPGRVVGISGTSHRDRIPGRDAAVGVWFAAGRHVHAGIDSRDAIECHEGRDGPAAECQVNARWPPIEHGRRQILHLGMVLIDRRHLDRGRLVPAPHRERRLGAFRGRQERCVEDERGVAADHLQALSVRRREAAIELCHQPAREAQLSDEGAVDASLVEPREGRHDVRLLTRHPTRKADRITADVPKRAAAHAQVRTWVVRGGQEEGEAPADELEGSERAAAREVDGTDDLRMVEVHERLHRDPTHPLRGGRHGIDLGDAQRERLLAQHVLSGFQGADRPLSVQVVRERDVHRVDSDVGQEGLVRAVGSRDAMQVSEPRGSTCVPAGDREEIRSRTPTDGAYQARRDATRTDDPPAEGRSRAAPASLHDDPTPGCAA